MRGLVAHHLNSEIADLLVTEHPPERLGVGRRGQQVPQRLLLVLVVGDDQGLPLAAHRTPSPVVCLLTNNSISRCLIGRARLRQLHRVTREFQPHRAAGPLTAPQPVPDRRHHRPQPLGGLAQGDHQRAHSSHVKRLRTRWRLASRKLGHIFDVQLAKLRP